MRGVMEARPLFLMGNKRSGSTLLVNLLNAHPRIFVTHESDIVWILYRASIGELGDGECHPLDASRGMESTLAHCGEIIGSVDQTSDRDAIIDAFYRVQEHINRHGSDMDKRLAKVDVAWTGDKKPVQHCDPGLRGFLREHFPSARYLHVARDPKGVVASMMRAAESWKVVPDYWKGTAFGLLERWAIHEAWALEVAEEDSTPVHRLRLEDLCARPIETMERVFEFLDVELPAEIEDRIRRSVYTDPNAKYTGFELPASSRAAPIMELYGY